MWGVERIRKLLPAAAAVALTVAPLPTSVAAQAEAEDIPGTDGSVVASLGALRPVPGLLPEADSADLRDEARRAQRRFERLRRHNLPATAPFSSPCDEIVGRFCFWHSDGREPPPERTVVVEGRLELIRTLDSIAVRVPGDGWVAGQRVRYRVEAGDHEGAIAAASACRSPGAWWCHALQGYAFHAASDFVGADSAFRLALDGMPEEQRCEWTDLSLLLEGDGRRHYGELECGERESFEEAFWRLSDPLWLLPGNDRRTEHFSRHVLDRLQEGADSGYGVPWRGDLRELLIRYGWPAGFKEIRRLTGLSPMRPDVMAYDAPGTRHFTPPAGWPAASGALERGRWDLDPPRPRSYYLPAYARHFRPLVHALEVFRRGDSAVVVAAYDLAASRDTLSPCDSVVAGLGGATYRSPVVPAMAVESGSGEQGVLSTTVSLGGPGEALAANGETRLVVSVEAFCPGTELAARERYVEQVPYVPLTGIGLSNLLLLDGEEDEDFRLAGEEEGARLLAASLEEATARIRPSPSVRGGERLLLYWEVYRGPGAPAAGAIRVSIHVTTEGRGFFRRALEWVGLADGEDPATGLEWREEMPRKEAVGRFVVVTLPDLPEGTYRLELEVRAPGQDPLLRTRKIEVEG